MNKKELMADILAFCLIVGLFLYFIFLFPIISQALIDIWPPYAFLDNWVMFTDLYPVAAFITYLLILIALFAILVFIFHIHFKER
jgi:hypothetical protein